MIRGLLTAVLMVFELSAFPKAYAEEVLNLELFCDGKVELKFEDANKEKKFESIDQLLKNNLLLQLGITKKISERITIKDNMIGKGRVIATDTRIFLSEESVSELLNKTGIKIEGYIDRLTGKFEVNAIISDQESEEFILFLELGLIGVQSSGDCKKLNPKKKLF